MSATEKARIEASLGGGAQVASEAKKMDANLGKVGSSFGTKLKDGAKGVLASLSAEAGRAIRQGAADAQTLDLATMKLGQSAGVAGSALRSSFERMEQHTLQSSLALADFSSALGRATYDGKNASEVVGTLSEEALAMGRELGDQLPLGIALDNMGVKAGKAQDELGRLRTMAESLGYVGGPAALKDLFAAIGPQLAEVTFESEEARHKFEALIATMTKDMKPAQAARTAGSYIETMKSRASDLQRTTGKKVLDENGRLLASESVNAFAAQQQNNRRKFSDRDARKRAAMESWGADFGLALVRTDMGQAAATAMQKSTGKTQKEAKDALETKEAKRIQAELSLHQGARQAGDVVNKSKDYLTKKIGPVGASIVGNVAETAMDLVPERYKPVVGAVALGGAYAAQRNSDAEDAAAAQRKDAKAQGYDNEREYLRDKQRGRLPSQLAESAMGEGGSAGGGSSIQIQAETLATLKKLDATLSGLPAQNASAVEKAKLTLTIPVNPNGDKGQ